MSAPVALAGALSFMLHPQALRVFVRVCAHCCA
jgi:hypothetical protein